jgi:diaminopimelate epimerase
VRNAFFKGHGLGNDYLVVDPEELDFAVTPANVRRLCDRHTGVGADGVLALVPSRRADFGLRIWNPDGSEAEKSGNGLRIFARFLHATARTRRK